MCKNNASKPGRSESCSQELRFSCPLIVCPARLEQTLPFLVANNPNKSDCGKRLTWKTIGQNSSGDFKVDMPVLGLAGCHWRNWTVEMEWIQIVGRYVDPASIAVLVGCRTMTFPAAAVASCKLDCNPENWNKRFDATRFDRSPGSRKRAQILHLLRCSHTQTYN